MDFRYALQDAWRCVPDAGLILRHALWDLVLGVVPILLAWAFAGSLGWNKGWRGAARWVLGALWLVFLPNAAYLIAALRSIPDTIFYIFQAFARFEIYGGRRTTASLMWVFFYVGVALAGVLCYGAATFLAGAIAHLRCNCFPRVSAISTGRHSRHPLGCLHHTAQLFSGWAGGCRNANPQWTDTGQLPSQAAADTVMIGAREAAGNIDNGALPT